MKVLSRQSNSKMCIICGMDNDAGVKAPFYNMEDGSVASVFEFRDIHQSYPERTHGGLISTMLDEIMGRVLWFNEDGNDDYEKFAVTMSLTIKYRKPVPYGVKVKARGYYVKDTSRAYVSRGEIFDMDGNLLAEAEASYMKMSQSAVVSNPHAMEEEMCYHFKKDIDEIDFPPKRI